jgi:hypothetical protein
MGYLNLICCRFERLFILIRMAVRAEDRLQTIEELSLIPQSIPKACTLGLIIDSTSAYFDESKIKYVKKIKVVDDTYNTGRYNPHHKYSYLTVFFYSPKIEDLPNPRHLGDLLYLRRYTKAYVGSRSENTMIASKLTILRLITAIGQSLVEIRMNLLSIRHQESISISEMRINTQNSHKESEISINSLMNIFLQQALLLFSPLVSFLKILISLLRLSRGPKRVTD